LDETPNTPHLRGTVKITKQNGINIIGVFEPQGGGPEEDLLGGKCRHLRDSLHSLSFQIQITGGDLLGFRGVIDTAGNPDLILCGTFIVLESDGPEPGDTGTWVATKGGGPLIGQGKGRKGGSKGRTSTKSS
jgi:hypothetical protein